MTRCASARGAALPTAMAVLFITALLATVALEQALNVVDRTQADRRSTRAIAAADAGVSVALWRMNRMLRLRAVLSDDVTGTALREVGCVVFDAQLRLSVSMLAGPGWCPPTPWHRVDDGERHRYWVSTAVRLDGVDLIERRIVVLGQEGTRQRRVLAIARLRLDRYAPATPFELVRYQECSPRMEDAAIPDQGCPS